MERLFIFNGETEELIAVAGSNEGMLPFSTAPSNEQLNKDFTLQVSVPVNHAEAVHIKEGNYLGYLDLDGDLQAFNIIKVEDYHNGDTLERVAYAEHLFYELLDDVVTDQRAYNVTADSAMDKALINSRWQKGTVAELGLGNTNFYYNNALNNVREIVNVYGGELRFRLTYNAGKITGRYVDLLARRGADTGKRAEYTKDLTSIKRTLDATDIKTALYGRGKSSEIEETGGYTRKANFGDVIWGVSKGDPVDKPLGQEFVADPQALALYGRANGTRHRYGVVEFEDIEDPNELLLATWVYLQTVNKPRLTYEVTAVDLERISGLKHEAVRLGDTIFILDRDLGITVEARVIEIERDLADPANTVYKLGNFIPLFTNIAVELENVKKKLSEKEGIWDNATNPITDEDIKVEAPPVPTNITASGLFENINVKWDFDPSIKVAGYEVFASQVNGFTADASNLVWRGKTGGYSHKASPNQTWYFRVRAFNPAGAKSALSGQVTGSTAKITGTYIAEATIGDAHIKDVSADKLTAGEIDANEINVVNLNGDNINAGKVKAQYVEIGSSTTFETGYDPTAKLETVFQNTPPTRKDVIWVDTTDPNNVQWKVWDDGVGIWRLGPSGPRGPQGLQGLQGPQGDQGLRGPTGADGKTAFTHIAYADSADGTVGFSTTESLNKEYIGMYVDHTPTDSSNPADYKWTLIKGADGNDGIAGKDGEDGQTPYLHIAYATSADGSQGFSTTETNGKTYIGTYTDFTQADSTDYTKYTWAKIQGPQGAKGETGPQGPQGVEGPKGADGKSLYTWVKYADTSTGGGMSDSPTGKLYIGLAYNKTTATESSTASDYTWSLIKGDKGATGPAGADGVTTYTWVKYADDDQGNGMSDSPEGKRYLGLAYNKTTTTESTNKADYSWSPLYDNVKVGGRNLVTGTSGSYREATISGWGDYADPLTNSYDVSVEGGATYTARIYLKTSTHEASVRIRLRQEGVSGYTDFHANYVAPNSEGYSTVTFTVPAGEGYYVNVFSVRFSASDTPSNTVSFKELKVEKGNIATDWTPAPEDVSNEIGDAVETVTTEYTTAISNAVDAVNIEVSKSVTDAEGRMVEYTDTKVSATEDSFNIRFGEMETTQGAHGAQLDEVYSYFKFNPTGLNIGKSDSPLQINISNEQMDFIDNGTVVAYVNGQKMYIDSLEVLSNLIVGNHKIEKYNSNITLIKWVGG